MAKVQSLAEYLDVSDPRPEAELPPSDFEALADIADAETFCRRVLETREFRQYIMNGIVLGDIPAAIIGRVMDHAWGKPVERHELTGKNGQPIETITEVRRVIVRTGSTDFLDQPEEKKPVTH